MNDMSTHIEQALGGLKKAEEYVKIGMDTILDYTSEYVEMVKIDGTNEGNQVSDEYKSLLQRYVKMEHDLTSFVEAMENAKQMIAQGENDAQQVLENFDQFYQGQLQKQPKPEVHEAYRKMIRTISDVDGEEDVDMGDEDLVIAEETQSYRCPFTGREMVDPVKNQNCGHTYDREGIMIYIKQRGRSAKCPVSGCASKTPVTQKCLVADKKLRKEIEKKNRETQK